MGGREEGSARGEAHMARRPLAGRGMPRLLIAAVRFQTSATNAATTDQWLPSRGHMGAGVRHGVGSGKGHGWGERCTGEQGREGKWDRRYERWGKMTVEGGVMG